MKRTLSLIAFIIVFQSKAQITFEKTYFSQNSATLQWWHSKFSNTQTKYLVFNEISMTIKIFNQDHSVYKTVNVPPQGGTYGADWTLDNQWQFCSEKLFNTDTLFEFAVIRKMTLSNLYYFKVYNENGTALFIEDSVAGASNEAFDSPAGLKLALYMLTPTLNTCVSVYSIGGIFLGIKKQALSENELNIYPNPASNFFKVEYTLPSHLTEAKMEIYSVDVNF